MVAKLLITLGVSTTGGFLLRKLKIPGGMILGAVVASLLLTLVSPWGYMPKAAKSISQLLAGAYIASSVTVNEIKEIRRHFKPTVFLLVGHLVLNLGLGTLLYAIGPFDMITSYASLIPGGLSEIPLVAEEMGGDSSIVLVIQFLRIVFSLLSFPLVASRLSKTPESSMDDQVVDHKKGSLLVVLMTCLTGLLGAILFKSIHFPAGILVGSMLSTLVLQILTNKAWLPRSLRWLSQILAGAYIGCLITSSSMAIMRESFAVIAISSLLYILGCFCISYCLHKFFGLPPRIATLSAMPAGVNDVAMIAADFNIKVGEIAFYQIARIILAVVFFPILLELLARVGFPFF